VSIIIALSSILLLSGQLLAEEKTDRNSEIPVEELIELSLEDLSKVKVVSVSKRLQIISEAPATVRVITAKHIKERGYLTLDEALADLPGFQFRNMVGYNSYVFQRGVASQNNLILILIDGIQINELNSGGFYGGGQYNLSNVERIEVVYGPASALYGTNAISGIVNIITKDPEDNEGLSVSALYGSFNTMNTDLSYGYYDEENDLGFRVSGMLKQTDKADLAGEKGDDNWTEDQEIFEDDISFDAKITHKDFSAGLVFQDKQASTSTSYSSVGTKYCDYGSNWHIRFINGYLKHVYDCFKNWSLSSQLYCRNATVMDNSIINIAEVDTTQVRYQRGYYRPNDLIGFEGMISCTPYEELNLIGGVVFEKENLAEGFSKTYSDSPDEKPPTPKKPKMVSNDLQSLYLQAQYLLLKSMQLTVGVRLDNSSVYDREWTPRVGLVYNKDRLTAKLLYMEAFRAPKPWDYTWSSGNPDLEPEEMSSLEAVLAYNILDNLRAETSIYKNTVTDVLTKNPEGIKWINRGKLKTDGFELTLSYYATKFTSYINYTYNDSRDDDGEWVPEIADHSVNVGILYAFTNKFKLNLSGNYLGERKSPHIIPNTGKDIVDPAFVVNSVLTYSHSHNMDIQLIVKNVLDEEYYHTSNRSDLSYLVSRFRQPQRTVLLRLGWHFDKSVW